MVEEHEREWWEERGTSGERGAKYQEWGGDYKKWKKRVEGLSRKVC